MRTLYLCFSRFLLWGKKGILVGGMAGMTLLPALAQAPKDKAELAEPPPLPVAPVQPPPNLRAINFRERPKFPTEPQRLRRMVQVDGVMGTSEWDAFYTVEGGPVKGTVYCNWDENYLYLAAKTDQPAGLLFNVDMGGDGWLRSADNLEIVVGDIQEGLQPTLVTRLLDAASSKDAPVWNEKAIDAKSILIAGKVAGGTQVVELAIPRNTASLVLRSGANIGLRVEPLPPGPASAYVPTQPFEPHLLLDAILVDSRVQTLAGVNPKLTLSDSKCIAGQNLFATLELLNQTDQTYTIQSVLWQGQGEASQNAVNTLREVTVPPLEGAKTRKLRYKTTLPPALAPGSYALAVTVEMGNGKQVQAVASFAVVEPIQAQMASDPQPVAIIGQTKLTVSVDVFSAVSNGTSGEVELTNIPAGWELAGKPKRSFEVDREDARRAVRFAFKLPSTTAAGEYPLEANVTWRGRRWNLRHVVRVVRTDAPKP